MKRKVLVTGGAGYIGSHTVIKLVEAGYSVVIFDSLVNSSPVTLDRIKQILGIDINFIRGDIRDRVAIRKAFDSNHFTAVIHFAGLKAVGESERFPLKYYDYNVLGSIVLFEEMIRAGVEKVIFSSSATVYGDPGYSRYTENTPLAPVNVYGKTKLIVENLLSDLRCAIPSLRIAILRYFNPIGAHESGLIGENPIGIPNNLMPFIAQVAVGKRTHLSVFGSDYSTPDGTCLRDYIHVQDLATGHVAALNALMSEESIFTVNLGTGRPYSVFEMIQAFEKASGRHIPYKIIERRPGDLPAYYADPILAKTLLSWEARFGIDKMCEDVWRWQSNNPEGYQ